MIKRRRFPKIFFGWWTAISAGIIAFWAVGIHIYGFSALLKPISSSLGFSRAAASVPSSIGRLEGGIEGPVVGYLSDRFGTRWIIFLGVCIMSLSLILMYFINSLWGFWLVWGIMLGTGVNLAQSISSDTAITNWFVKKRGLAMGIRRALGGLGGTVVLPLMAWLLVTQGWRMTCFIGGITVGLISLPLAWFGFKSHRPEYYGLLPDGATVEEEAADTSRMIEKGIKYASEFQEVEFTLRQALRTPAFWLLTGSTALYFLVVQGFTVHIIPFLTDIGFEPVKAAAILAIMSAISTPFRFLGGPISDRIKRGHLRFLLAGAFSMMAIGFAVFLIHPTTAMLYVWIVLYGVSHGLALIITVIIVPRYFGRKAFGSIRGTSMVFTLATAMTSPIYAGWVYDTTGSYITVFMQFAIVLTFATILMTLALPPKPPTKVTDISNIL
ncbi:MFS transporter [Chloroflexota bacterium]